MKTPEGCFFLGIDLGTSGPKVGIVSMQGEVLGWESEETKVHLLPGGGAEQDPAEWWEAIVKAVRRLLDRDLVHREAIQALACTAQWSGTVAVDREGKPLRRAIIWLDSRGEPSIRRLTQGVFRLGGYSARKLALWVRRTGGIPGLAGRDPIAHILFLREEEPETYRKTHKFLEPKDYLNLVLTGEFAATFDSITLHWVTDTRNIDAVRYDRRLLDLATLDRKKLPDLVPSTQVLGTLQPAAAEALGLSEQTKVVAGTPDIFSAALGSGAVQDYETHLYIGTSSWISCHVPFKKTDLFHNIASLPSAIPGKYLVADEQIAAGAAVAFARDHLLCLDGIRTDEIRSRYEVLDEIVARSRPGAGGVLFTPWLYGERSPISDRFLRGGFHNLSLDTSRDDLIRAVYEGVAFNTRWLFQYFEKFLGRRVEALNMIGGGAQSDIWCQIMADVLNRKIRQVKDPILSNLRGVGLLAAAALGEIRIEQSASRLEIRCEYLPTEKNRDLYDSLFARFLDVYERTRKIHRGIDRSGA